MAALVLPSIAGSSTAYVNDVIAVATNQPATGDIGGMQGAILFMGLAYIVGGVLFAIALFRANVLARWASALLAVGTLSAIGAGIVPQYERLFAIPTGLALVGLGYSLWRAQRTPGAVPAPILSARTSTRSESSDRPTRAPRIDSPSRPRRPSTAGKKRKEHSMTSYRKTALVGGILYLVTFIGSIAAAILVGPAISDPDYVTGAGADQQVALGAVFELVNVFGLIGCGVALFSVVKKVHEGLAIGYLATRLFEGATITVGVLCLLAVTSLHQQAAAAADAASLLPAGQRARRHPDLGHGHRREHGGVQRADARDRPVQGAARPARDPGPRHRRRADPHHLGHRHDPRPDRARDPVPRHRGHAVLHLGAGARSLADLQGLQRELSDRARRPGWSGSDRAVRSGAGGARGRGRCRVTAVPTGGAAGAAPTPPNLLASIQVRAFARGRCRPQAAGSRVRIERYSS